MGDRACAEIRSAKRRAATDGGQTRDSAVGGAMINGFMNKWKFRVGD